MKRHIFSDELVLAFGCAFLLDILITLVTVVTFREMTETVVLIHVGILFVLCIASQAIKARAEAYEFLKKYTRNFWRNSLVVSFLLGMLIAVWLLSRMHRTPPTWVVTNLLLFTGIYMFLPLVAGIKAFLLIWKSREGEELEEA